MLRNWFNSFKIPALDWVQVEVTSFCNASCIYCPRTILQTIWQNRHIPMHLYKRLIPVFEKTDLVFLQGWGEPFMNPDLFPMITLAKQANCRVGTTTNGTLLDEDTIRRLIDSELDILCLSLADTDRKTNDQIRHGTSFTALFNTLYKIEAIKQETNSRLPAVHIAYLLLASGLNNINLLPTRLKDSGVTEVVVSTLDFTPNRALRAEAIRPASQDEYNAICRQLTTIRQEAAGYGINLHYQITNPVLQQLTCTENIENALFISSDGTISPCVFTNLPVALQDFQDSAAIDQIDQYQQVSFGTIDEEKLSDIWRSRDYAGWRRSFVESTPPEPCTTCPKRFIG